MQLLQIQNTVQAIHQMTPSKQKLQHTITGVIVKLWSPKTDQATALPRIVAIEGGTIFPTKNQVCQNATHMVSQQGVQHHSLGPLGALGTNVGPFCAHLRPFALCSEHCSLALGTALAFFLQILQFWCSCVGDPLHVFGGLI